jgi:hypothetical protein
MITRQLLALGIAGATVFTVSMPAHAEGKTDQARKTIAAAQAKIDAANIVGAAGDAPRLHAQAVTTLHVAQDELAHHAKDEAIRDATRASELADMALAASTHERTNEQRASVEAAQSQAAQANARASEALTAAAAAQADAAAARATPPVIIQTSPPTAPPATTTVTTTETEGTEVRPATSAGKKTVRHTVRHRAPVHRHTRTTRTTVTTRP